MYSFRSTSGSKIFSLVQDGTPCGDNLVRKTHLIHNNIYLPIMLQEAISIFVDFSQICINQTCTSMNPYIDTHNKCPSNHNNLECSAHGVSGLDYET